MKNIENRTGLMEVYRASFRNFTLAAAQLQTLPADPIAQEMALAEVEEARQAYNRSRDALVPVLLGRYPDQDASAKRREAAACCC